MHSLTSIKISNFRSCVNADFEFADFTPLVGINNSGKSNILAATKWLLRPFSLISSDFYDREHPVFVQGKISGITGEILDRLESTHRSKIEPYCSDETLSIRTYQPSPDIPKKKIEQQVLDLQGDLENDWKKAPTGIPEALYALFPAPIEIGAMEDAAEDAAKFKTSTTIGKLIADIIGPIRDEHGDEIREELSGLRQKLDSDGSDRPAQMQDFDVKANKALSSFFPDISVRLHIPTPKLDELFKTGTIKVYEQDGNPQDISQLGHGAQRAIQMALVQCLAERNTVSTDNASRKLLIVEEPELYMHPHGIEQVRVSLKKLSKVGYQVLVATHSPLVIGSEDVPDTLLIRKSSSQGTIARPTLRHAIKSEIADHPSQAKMLFSLTNSSQILFAESILLAEGTTENRLIPSLFERSQDKTLGIAKIALISQGGVTNTSNSMSILNAMAIPCKAVVDLDYAFRVARSDGLLAADDEDIVRCKEIISEIASAENCILDEQGLPMKGGALSAAEAFVHLGVHQDAIPHIESLHAKLLEKNIWLWKLGSIDTHLGLDGRSENAWAGFLQEFEESGFDFIPDEEGIRDFMKWLDDDSSTSS